VSRQKALSYKLPQSKVISAYAARLRNLAQWHDGMMLAWIFDVVTPVAFAKN
jgi:hypothetical protein